MVVSGFQKIEHLQYTHVYTKQLLGDGKRQL